jgi:hypothetical protein
MLNIPGDSRTVLVCWSPLTDSLERIDRGVITLYHLNDLQNPYLILVCEAQITHCVISPLHPHIVLAGTMDGSLQAWDSTEVPGTELWPDSPQTSYHIQRPSYSTDGLYPIEKCHEDYIVALAPLVSVGENSSGDSFQLASVDASGKTIIWVRH